MVTTLLLAPPYTTENLTGVRVPIIMLTPGNLPALRGQSKSIAQLFSSNPLRWGSHPYSLIILSQVAYKCQTRTQTCALLSPRLDVLPTAIISRLIWWVTCQFSLERKLPPEGL